jgi:purine-nucleoside phosphorylase
MMKEKLIETRKFLEKHIALRPKLAFVLGSGLAAFANEVDVETEIPFGEIPHFAKSSVEGHPGRLIAGRLEGLPVVMMQGRIHAYEGLSFQEVVHPVRSLAMFGVNTLIVTNAAGGLSSKMRPGDFMVIRDHINLTGGNPLVGPNLDLGPRFVDMTEPYDKSLSTALTASFKAKKARVHQGVYVGVLGPTYETAAEIRFYSKIGGGAVGMSTVAEVIAARHAGLRVAGVSCITNLGTGLSRTKLSHKEVKDVAQMVEKKFAAALLTFTKKIKSKL